MAYLAEDMQQRAHAGKREGQRVEIVGVELQVRRRHWNMPLDRWPQPHHAAAAEILLGGDANQRQGATAQRMPRINHRDRVLRRKRQL
jgi:hypothetical protein